MRRTARGVVVDFAEASDPGLDPDKQTNEDATGSAETPLGFVAVVCDGMGGHSKGREAANVGVRTIVHSLMAESPESDPRLALKAAIERAAQDVYAVGGDAALEMRPGSTCAALMVHERGAEIAHIGDSRVYLIRNGTPSRLTRDHSMVQELIDQGSLKAEDAALHPDANRITRALGMAPHVEPELRSETFQLQNDDLLLLCSDGLTDLANDAELAQLANEQSTPLQALCKRYVSLANARGGHDNITVQLLHVLSMPSPRLGDTYVDTTTEPPPAPAKTLVEESTKTWIDEDKGAPLERTVDGQVHVAPGKTVIDDGPTQVIPPRPRSPEAATPNAVGKPKTALKLWLVGAACVLSIFAAVGVWAIVHKFKGKESQPPPPPPEPTEPAPPANSGPQAEPDANAHVLELPQGGALAHSADAKVSGDASDGSNPDAAFP